MKRLIIPALIALSLSACSTKTTYIEKDHKLIQSTDYQNVQVRDTQVYDTQVYDKDRQVYDTNTQVYDRENNNSNTSQQVIINHRTRRPVKQEIINDID